MKLVTYRSFLVGVACAGLVALVGCSSSTNSTPASSGKKTCADVQKCCETATEPTKTSCTPVAAAKNEDLCAQFYEKSCGGGGGADGGGADGGGGGGDVTSQCTAYCKAGATEACPGATCQKDCEASFAEAKTKNCLKEYEAFIKCGTTATYTCTGGELSTNDCTAETAAASACGK